MSNLIPIEMKNQRVLTTAQLAEEYGTEVKRITDNYNGNRSRYQEGKHYFCLEGTALKEFKNETALAGFVGERVNKLYLWTEKGALLHAKSLNTDEAWGKYDELVDGYFKMRDALSEPRPACIEDVLIQSLQEMKAVKLGLDTANKRLDTIGDLLTLNPNDWRTGAKDIIVKIAEKLGGTAYIPEVHNEIYKLVEANLGVNLKRRLDNMKARMLFNGMCKSKVDRLTRVDVIAENKGLLNGYIKVIRELAIKYGIDKVEV